MKLFAMAVATAFAVAANLALLGGAVWVVIHVLRVTGVIQ